MIPPTLAVTLAWCLLLVVAEPLAQPARDGVASLGLLRALWRVGAAGKLRQPLHDRVTHRFELELLDFAPSLHLLRQVEQSPMGHFT